MVSDMKDVWAYIKACFWSALALRQAARAIISFVVAVLAVPLLYLMGGALELTEKGLWWGAAWLTFTTLLLMFVIAPFFLWREYREASIPTLPVDPITYVELAQIAVRDFGWNFGSRWEALDFENCMRQACSAGALMMEAKANPDNISERFRDQHLPVEIPRDAWRERRLYIEADAHVRLDQTDNWTVLVQTIDGATYRNQYRDPQLTKRADAIEWLRRHGPRFRGNSEREDNKKRRKQA
jgi:hypothetical protein